MFCRSSSPLARLPAFMLVSHPACLGSLSPLARLPDCQTCQLLCRSLRCSHVEPILRYRNVSPSAEHCVVPKTSQSSATAISVPLQSVALCISRIILLQAGEERPSISSLFQTCAILRTTRVLCNSVHKHDRKRHIHKKEITSLYLGIQAVR